MKNRDGWNVELSQIETVDDGDDYWVVKQVNGWTLQFSKHEAKGFVPQVDDVMVLYTRGLSSIVGIVIDGHVIRYADAAQYEIDTKAMLDRFRLEKLERYIKSGDELKARVSKLHPALAARMERFAEKDGVEFWIDSAEYEMAALEGANALLEKVASYNLTGDRAVGWINSWNDLAYKVQMETVPDFGDGHSGWTASAAVGLAKRILEGQEV